MLSMNAPTWFDTHTQPIMTTIDIINEFLRPLEIPALANITKSLPSEVELVVDTVNPLQFPILSIIPLVLLKFLAEELLDSIIKQTLTFLNHPKLPSREPVPVMKGLEHLQAKDLLYLAINEFINWVFLVHLFRFVLTLPMDLESLSFTNTVVAFYVTFYTDDFFYYFLHRFMHLPLVYPYIHKHHHRQALPFRGYLDAANESPVEQLLGLACVWSAIQLLHPIVGFHAITVVLFFSVFAIMAIMNHTPYDVQLGLWGLNYSVRAHETHHRMVRCNYAQNTMLWDRLFGTYLEYPTRSKAE